MFCLPQQLEREVETEGRKKKGKSKKGIFGEDKFESQRSTSLSQK